MNNRKRRKSQRDGFVKYMEDYTQKLGHTIEQRLTFGTSYKSIDK